MPDAARRTGTVAASRAGPAGGVRRRETWSGRVPGSAGRLLVRSRAMDRRLARRNLRTALLAGMIGLVMFALTFLAAALYVQ
jgi:hypothetical protein